MPSPEDMEQDKSGQMPKPDESPSHLNRFPRPDERLDEECRICQDELRPSDRAQLIPCFHWQYHKECIETWLNAGHRATCPLCNQRVTAIRWGLMGSTARSIIPIRPSSYRHRQRPRRPPPAPPTPHQPFPPFRVDIYREGRYALHIGSSSYNSYRTLSVSDFQHDDQLTRRATAFIRRELLIIDCLNPRERRQFPDAGPMRSLLEQRVGRNYWGSQRVDYVMRVLRAVDMQSANGAAEEILRPVTGEFTGLFLHELRAFLRSPFGRVEEWDEVVRYGPPTRGMRADDEDGYERRAFRLPGRGEARAGEARTFIHGVMSHRLQRGQADVATESF